MTRPPDPMSESASVYQVLVESAPDALFVADAETGEIVETNEAAEDLLGRPREEIVGRFQWELHPEDERERYRELFEAHVRSEGVRDCHDDGEPLYVATADGGTVPVTISASRVEFGGRGLVVGHFRDITEHHERERELGAICQSIPDLAIVYEADGTYREVLSGQGDVLVEPADVLEGKRVSEVLPADVAGRIRESIRRAIDTGEPQRLTYSLRLDDDADPRWFDARLSRLDATEYDAEHVLFLARETTASERRKRELRSFKTAVEQAGHAVLLTDAEGRIEYANPAFESTTGYDEAEILGGQPSLLQSGEHDDEFYSDLWETITAGDVWEGDLVNERKDGERYHIHQTIAPVTDEDGDVERFVGVNTDITDRVRYQRQLEREREQLDLFASTVAHDLRNPLAIALGNVEIALESGDDASLDVALDALERMDAMISEILTLSKQGRTVQDPEAVPLRQVLDRAWAAVETRDAALSVADAAAAHTIEADATRFQELLENLFRNAVEHGSPSPRSPTREDAVQHGSTSPRSPTREDAAERDAANVTVGLLADARGFYVEDDGSGIDVDPPSRVFNTGFTTAEDGVGFGLTIVEQIADAHGWSVSVAESEAGGARFEFVTDSTRDAEADDSDREPSAIRNGLNSRWNQPSTMSTDEDARDASESVRVWLVERTYSDDEQNLIILTYATPDGERYFRKERALTSFSDVRDTTAAVAADPENLGPVDDPDLRAQYAAEARRMRELHDPDDAI